MTNTRDMSALELMETHSKAQQEIIEQLRQERHQLQNELTAATLDNERLNKKCAALALLHYGSPDEPNAIPEATTGGEDSVKVSAESSRPRELPCVWRSGCQDVPRCTEAGKCLQISRKG